MYKKMVLAALLGTAASWSPAQTAPAATASAAQTVTAPASAASGVRESTEPQKAAAVEKAAAVLKSRPPQAPVEPVRGKSAAGHDFLSGGITAADRSSMNSERSRYSLWVATVAKPSGAYLADTALRIVDLQRKSAVFERKLEGPWLFINLPAGRYELSVVYRETSNAAPQTLKQTVQVAKQGQRQAVLRFESAADIDPDRQSAGESSPFNPPAAAPAPGKARR